MVIMNGISNAEDCDNNHENSDDGNFNYDTDTDEEDNDKNDNSNGNGELEWFIFMCIVQVCYPSLLVTPQHWSRVPHARFDYFLH